MSKRKSTLSNQSKMPRNSFRMIRNLAQVQTVLRADLHSSCPEVNKEVRNPKFKAEQNLNPTRPQNAAAANPQREIVLPQQVIAESTYSQVSITSHSSDEESKDSQQSISSVKGPSQEATITDSFLNEITEVDIRDKPREYYVFMRQLPHLSVPDRLEYYALSKGDNPKITRVLLHGQGEPLKLLQWHQFTDCLVAKKNVVICRGKALPLLNRGNPAVEVPELSATSKVYDVCTVKLKFYEEDLKKTGDSKWVWARSEQLPRAPVRINLLFKEGITGPTFPVEYSCCAILASKTMAMNMIEIPSPVNLN